MRTIALLAAGAALALPAHASAELRLAPAIAGHAVLQRDRPIVIEGEADAGAAVTVTLGTASGKAKADRTGHWRATLPAMPATATPLTLTASDGKGGSATASDLLVGDVWLCSGQSNMEMAVRNALSAWNETRGARDDQLRFLTIPKGTAPVPQRSFAGPVAWKLADTDSAMEFSAACYYMVRDLRKSAGVPIGAIHSSWGGTQSRPWLTPDGVGALYGASEVSLLQQFTKDPLAANATFEPRWTDWYRAQTGTAKGAEPWLSPDAVQWQPVPQIAFWDTWGKPDLVGFKGIVFFRRTVTLTPEQAKAGATLSIGVIDDLDQSWVNGRPVGNSFGWDVERSYAIPATYWKPGANEIVVAVTNSYATGGFQGPANKVALQVTGGDRIALADGWRYFVSKAPSNPPRAPWDINGGLGVIHNSMIAPLGGYAMKGAAWYQGESDAGMPDYDKRMGALMRGWRAQFGNPDFAVQVVSLANYGSPQLTPGESGWADVRAGQRAAVLADPHAGLAVAMDIGDWRDLHPSNKIELGHRLAQAARATAYGSGEAPLGPDAKSAVREGGDVVVTFGGVKDRLTTFGSAEAIGFELCGEGPGTCRFARAIPQGASVRIVGDGQPVSRVRYAWADAPAVNLYDAVPLPVGPFEMVVK